MAACLTVSGQKLILLNPHYSGMALGPTNVQPYQTLSNQGGRFNTINLSASDGAMDSEAMMQEVDPAGEAYGTQSHIVMNEHTVDNAGMGTVEEYDNSGNRNVKTSQEVQSLPPQSRGQIVRTQGNIRHRHGNVRRGPLPGAASTGVAWRGGHKAQSLGTISQKYH